MYEKVRSYLSRSHGSLSLRIPFSNMAQHALYRVQAVKRGLNA